MTTAAAIVNKALTSLGASNQLTPDDPYLQEQFFDLLIEMLDRWASIDIGLGLTIPTIPADELGEPESTTSAIYTSLAIDGQDIVKVVAPASLRRRQKIAYRDMKAAFGLWPQQSFPSSLPFGQGVNVGPRTKRFFPEPDTVGSDSDTSLGV